jgi:hypothetical protein
MSYPPKVYDEHGSPSMAGESSSSALNPEDALESEIKEKEEEELNAVRRYEDFTTVGPCLYARGFLELQLIRARLDTG